MKVIMWKLINNINNIMININNNNEMCNNILIVIINISNESNIIINV